MLQKFNSWNNVDLGLFLVRLALGIVFIAHGWQKLQNTTGVIGFFGSLGFSPMMAYIVIIVELLGGLFILLGFFVRPVGILLAVVMATAISSVHLKNGLLAQGGYEFPLTLLLISLAVSAAGAGRYSLPRFIKKNQ